MKNLITSSLFAVLVAATFVGVPVQAQTYAIGACVNLTSNLSVGSRGSEVRTLQSFLVAQNYPGGGSWMITGYYGQATAAAVRIFQQYRGLSQTGIVDSATRTAIANASCGYLTTPTVGTPLNYSSYFTYPYTYPTYTNPGTVSITSMSQNTGVPGDSLTLYGVGFDSVNTIYFGSQTLSGISSNGTSLTLTIPSYYTYAANQSVQLYVANSRGTSNKMTFTIYPYGTYYPYNQYPYQNQFSCLYGGFGCPTGGVPTVSYLTPTSGGVGTTVTIFGTGFSASGNSVHLGNGVIANLNSPDGRSVSFTVPAQLTGFGTQPIAVGTYNVSVTNAQGLTSNTLPFTITSTSASAAPSITGLNGPTTLATGQQGTWTVQINNPSSSYLTVSVAWGDTSVYGAAASAPQTLSVQGQTSVTFTHTYYVSGTYTPTFTVSNAYGAQNSTSATVVVSGQTAGAVFLSYLSPSAGRVGTQIVISGTGFNAYDNTVHFGVGGTQHVSSVNGTTIYYTIPSYVSPCDTQVSGYCALYAQQVTPGTYPIYITNANGTSNVLNFQVQ